jgi:hypothetical protein
LFGYPIWDASDCEVCTIVGVEVSGVPVTGPVSQQPFGEREIGCGIGAKDAVEVQPCGGGHWDAHYVSSSLQVGSSGAWCFMMSCNDKEDGPSHRSPFFHMNLIMMPSDVLRISIIFIRS